MKWTHLALIGCIAWGTAHAAPFYDGKPLAHPLLDNLSESSMTLAFFKEADGVKGYYSPSQTPDHSPQLLDNFGNASIESVFAMSLDHEIPTRFVLLKQQGRYQVRAYRYNANDHLYSQVGSLQKALDRIVDGKKTLDALTVKKALAQLTQLNHRFFFENSDIAEFDQIDHTQGTLVGYFDDSQQLINHTPPGEEQMAYKKTFQKKDGRFLTVTYWRGYGKPLHEGSRTVYNYQVSKIAWESEPTRYRGSEDGDSVAYGYGFIGAQGKYSHGLRTGEWHFSEGWENHQSGPYVEGKRQGQWYVTSPENTQTGLYENDQREGRWDILPSENDEPADNDIHGFDTYVHDQLNGPSERRVGDKTVERGNYLNGKRQGPWLTEDGSGNYENGEPSGPWTPKAL